MRILVLTIGSRGDVEPYLALALGLREAGHEVTLATHEPFRATVESRGVGFAPLPGDPRAVLAEGQAKVLQATGPSLLRFAHRFVGILKPFFDDLVAAVTPLQAAADLVMYSPLAFPAWHLAQVDGTPTVMAGLQPLHPTRVFPPPPLGGLQLGRVGNLAAHRVGQAAFWLPLRREVNRWRTASLGLPPLPITGPWRRVEATEATLYGFSPRVVPRPTDWPPQVTLTGFWFLDPTEERLGGELEAFLHDGPPPVYVGFGSLAPADTERLSEVAVAAARRAGQRLLLGAGWAELEAPSGSDVHVVGAVPHHLLFPRMAAVVHHGGAGTTATGLRAGRPTVVVPFYADQPFWGARVAAIGAGPDPVPASQLDPERLGTAISLALRPSIRRQAERVGAALRAEDGVGRAVTEIGRLAARAR